MDFIYITLINMQEIREQLLPFCGIQFFSSWDRINIEIEGLKNSRKP